MKILKVRFILMMAHSLSQTSSRVAHSQSQVTRLVSNQLFRRGILRATFISINMIHHFLMSSIRSVCHVNQRSCLKAYSCIISLREIKLEYNMRKYQVLDYVWRNGESTSQEISEALNLEIYNACMRLLSYHRQGLLQRSKELGVYVYGLTEKGYRRLEWLLKNVIEEWF